MLKENAITLIAFFIAKQIGISVASAREFIFCSEKDTRILTVSCQKTLRVMIYV